MNIKKGDVVLIKQDCIGIVRYIGYVKDLSNGKYDDFVGLEIKIKKSSNMNITGNKTENGEWNGHKYGNFVGLFVPEKDVIKQFSPEELLSYIDDKNALFNTTSQITSTKQQNITTLQPNIEKPSPSPSPSTNNGGLDDLWKRLKSVLSFNELQSLKQYCKSEEFTSGDITDDLDTFEDSDDSVIVDHMRTKFEWNQMKQQKFVRLALNTNDDEKETETETEIETKRETKQFYDTFPEVYDFMVPISIMRQRDPRSIRDIEQCFRKNNIPSDAIAKFRQFCKEQSYTFKDLESNFEAVAANLKSTNSSLSVFIYPIEKCLYELAPPLFKPGKFDRNDENKKFSYFESQCKGTIKHDRDLLQYFCLTEHTEKRLPSELIDIADRISIEEKQPLNTAHFATKYFFDNCDAKQTSTITSGLRKYHNRFFPPFPKIPLKKIADKISGYQKYCILLSHIIHSINNKLAYDKNSSLIPYMIDMMIIPPGCYNKIEDNGQKCYDASGPLGIGDIKQTLKGANIRYHETRGLNNKPNNFENAITQRITKQIVEFIKKITNNFQKPNQRIVLLVDRRWRVNCNKFDAYRKLKATKGQMHVMFDENDTNNYLNDDDDDDDEWDNYDNEGQSNSNKSDKKSGSWFTSGFGFNANKNNKNSKSNDPFKTHDYYKKNMDTIYVYQPSIKPTLYHEFNNEYCHETLLYLTKQCIIPRVNHISRTHIGGDTPDGWLFNISAHIEKPIKPSLYRYDMRWYIFLQSSALRFFPNDMATFWSKYFIDPDEDTDKMTADQIQRDFKFDLREYDANYKRWYYAIKRSD